MKVETQAVQTAVLSIQDTSELRALNKWLCARIKQLDGVKAAQAALNFHEGQEVFIDLGTKASKYNGLQGTVYKINTKNIVVSTKRGLVNVHASYLKAAQ